MTRTHGIGTAIAALGLLAAGAVHPLAAQEPPPERPKAEPPPAMPLEPVRFPAYQERTLDNGARVIVVEDHEQPVVSLSLRIRSGASADPAGKAGVASFTASLLDKGTTTRSAREIAESIDFVGGSLGASASNDATAVNATVLTEFLDSALVLMSDIVLDPTFPEDELETERTRTLSALQVELGQPSQLAARRFMREIYGEHPYGAAPTTESVRSIARADLVAFHQAHFRPEHALIVVAGDVRPDDVVARLNRHFADWRGAAVPSAALPEAPARDRREIVLVHKPASVQAVVRIGHLLPPATHEDWIALDVANQVLGGGTTGWFFRILRGEKGYTYGAYASAVQRRDPGYFQAWAEVRNEVADSAMAEFFRLLAALRDEPVPADDLRKAKDYMTGSFPLTIETPQQVAGQIASTRLLGLPHDYLARYRDAVAAVTAEEVQRVAREHIRPDHAAVVVVGDAVQLHDRLTAFGPVRVVDVNGAALSMAELRGGDETIPLDASDLQPQSLVYQFVVQGNPMVEVTTTLTRESIDGADAVRVRTSASGMISLDGDVAFEAAGFNPLYSRGEQQAGPQRTSHDLRVAGGRVTGSVTGPDGETRSVDLAAAPGLVLPGTSEYAIWVAELAPGKRFSLPSVSAQTGAATRIEVRVVGESTVQVGAGSFDVYELEVTGEGPPMRFFARKTAPHLVVKQEFAGQPIAIELKEIR